MGQGSESSLPLSACSDKVYWRSVGGEWGTRGERYTAAHRLCSAVKLLCHLKFVINLVCLSKGEFLSDTLTNELNHSVLLDCA